MECDTGEGNVYLPMPVSTRENLEKGSFTAMGKWPGVMVDGMRASGGMVICKAKVKKLDLMVLFGTKASGVRVSLCEVESRGCRIYPSQPR